ncbi:hypothetical protein [Kitasatospora sp. NBC_01266]|uniref:hypothetical protein n=1 Tax=Kitasatospora sp. NBC_01266 TaxID=2903572 RepID=UPI002E335DCE|nr:hypothetical protein [Kitasatospora sp. NBC_01266]
MVGGVAGPVSAATVRRWLRDDALKPWQHRSWILITHPGFRAKAQRVLDVYARTWQGVPLGEDEYVISADEKTSTQTRCRCHPTLAPGQARAMRVNHTYGRGGALAYLVHRHRIRLGAADGVLISDHREAAPTEPRRLGLPARAHARARAGRAAPGEPDERKPMA